MPEPIAKRAVEEEEEEEEARKKRGPRYMAGNVWEFTDSNYLPERGPKSGDTSVAGESVLKVIKGGGWTSRGADLRSAGRMGVPPGHRALDVGLRCASDPGVEG
jgi:formylglycine-generating enzyme required for sulfatase activity